MGMVAAVLAAGDVPPGISLGQIVALVVIAVLALFGGGGVLVWLVKRSTAATLSQSRAFADNMREQGGKLLDSALDNMKANTKAIEANTKATEALVRNMEHAMIVRDERDKSLFKTLERVEDGIDDLRRRK
jgi:hypothetical protein